jgi:hypothetical protein
MGVLSSKTWINISLKIVKKERKNSQVYETLNHDNFIMTTITKVR